MCAVVVVTYGVCKLARKLFLVMCHKGSINCIINPNPVSIH
jgi:hypothetical protein